MALTATARGTGNNKTAGTTLAVVPASNFAVGSLAVLVVAYDNTGTNGADPWTAISDNAGVGHTWTSRQRALRDPGAADAGDVLAIFTCPVTSLTTAHTITVTFGAFNVTAKAWALWEIKGAQTGGGAFYVTGNVANNIGTAFTITTGSITSGNAVIAGIALEDNATAGTDDADTTNGTWSTGQVDNTTGGNAQTNQALRSQVKVTTGTGAQTWNFTVSNNDWATAWIEVREGSRVTSLTADALFKKVVSSSFTANARILQAFNAITANAVRKQTFDNTAGAAPAGTWTLNDQGSQEWWGYLDYSNGYWTTTQNPGSLRQAIWWATDPTGTWTENLISTAELSLDVRYLNGAYYVVGGYIFGGGHRIDRRVGTDPTGAFTNVLLFGGGSNNNQLHGIDYGNGYYVAVGNHNGQNYDCTWYSTDGANWTENDSGFGASALSISGLVSVAYGNGYFVAIEGGGRVYYTTDPTVAWTLNTQLSSACSVHYANGYWVIGTAAGSGWYRATDPTGTFTSIPGGITTSTNDGDTHDGAIQYVNGWWIAVGGTTMKYRQGDPAGTWTSNNQPAGSNLNSVNYANGYWLAMGGNSSGVTRYLTSAAAGTTMDAVFKKTQSSSFTANAVFLKTTSSSFTANAVIPAGATTISGSFTASAVIQKTQSGSATADAAIKATLAGSLTADSVFLKAQSGSIIANAFIPGHFSAGAVFRATIAGSFTADSRVTHKQRGKVVQDQLNSIWYDQSGGTVDIFQSIDELSPDDNDYIRTDDNPSAATYEANVSAVEDPLRSDGHILRVRHLKTGSRAATVTATLFQSGGDIASFQVSPTEDTAATTAYTLTGAEADSIVDYSRLKIRFVGATTGGGPQTRLRVTWFELEVGAPVVATHTLGFIADAVFRKTQSGSFTGNAVILRTQTGSATADAVLKATQSGSLTAGAVIKATIAGSLTANAVTLRAQTGSLTADAVLKASRSGSFVADAIVSVGRTGSITGDATLLRTQAGSLSAGAVLFATRSGSLTADAIKRISVAGSLTADAVIQRTQLGSFTADAVLRRTLTGQLTGDAFVAGQLSANAVITRAQTGSLAGNAFIPGHLSADAVLRATQAGSFTASSYVQGAGVGVVGADAVIFATRSATLVAGAVVNRNQTGQFVALAVVGRTASGSLSGAAVLRSTIAGAVTSDATVLRTSSGALVGNAVVFRAITGSVPAGAVIASPSSGSIAGDATLRRASTGSLSADAFVQGAATFTFDAKAVALRTASATLAASAVIRVTADGGPITVDAVKRKIELASITGNAVILATRTAGASADAVFLSPRSFSLAAAAVILVRPTGSLTSDAVVTPASRGFTADALILSDPTGVVTASAVIRAIRPRHFLSTMLAPATISGELGIESFHGSIEHGSFHGVLLWPVTVQTSSFSAGARIE